MKIIMLSNDCWRDFLFVCSNLSSFWQFIMKLIVVFVDFETNLDSCNIIFGSFVFDMNFHSFDITSVLCTSFSLFYLIFGSFEIVFGILIPYHIFTHFSAILTSNCLRCDIVMGIYFHFLDLFLYLYPLLIPFYEDWTILLFVGWRH